VSVDFDNGAIVDESTGKTYVVAPMPAFMKDILTSGGLIEAVKAGKLEGNA
jgi:3-isopropylmalate/(R)-2-methylmalate dehydratase small subunit